MPSEPSPPAQLKDWFDEARYRSIARELTQLAPKFDAKTFLKLVLDGLEVRTLMERLHQSAVATDATLPGSFQQKVRVLQKLAPKLGHEFVTIFLGDFVATFGREDFDFSMEALRFFTVFGSSEFAVRPFIVADQERALKTLRQWTKDADEKVRRLASELPRVELSGLTPEWRRTVGFTRWRERLGKELFGANSGGVRRDTLICDGVLPLLTAEVAWEGAGWWFHWFPGDLPLVVKAGLRQLDYGDGRTRPLSNGVAQGLLGWLLAHEALR